MMSNDDDPITFHGSIKPRSSSKLPNVWLGRLRSVAWLALSRRLIWFAALTSQPTSQTGLRQIWQLRGGPNLLACLSHEVWWGIIIITILLHWLFSDYREHPCSWCFIIIFLCIMANSSGFEKSRLMHFRGASDWKLQMLSRVSMEQSTRLEAARILFVNAFNFTRETRLYHRWTTFDSSVCRSPL